MDSLKKIIKYIILFSLLVMCIFHYYQVDALDRLEGIENFPYSYKGYLEELSKRHPNWRFIALYTNLDWNYVINEENTFGKNLVPKNYSDNWKNTKEGQYNIEVDSGWVDSSRQAVEYCMDPRNFLNEVRIFQFERLSYDSYTNSLIGIEKILYGTEFYNRQVSYVDANGNVTNMNEKYSDLILRAGQTSLVSPYHLASRIKQEVGPFLTHSSISGIVEGFEGLYNFYNIGATSSSEVLGAIKNGLRYARDGKGASWQIQNKYLIPWNTKERAITGGAIFIGSSYINAGQNTIYQQKFDINNENGSLFWHQYMTNVLAPYSESKSIYNGYKNAGLIELPMTFIIPIYDNMPQFPMQSPDINLYQFTQDNTKVFCNGQNVNIRTGPSTSYDIITTVSNPETMLRIGIGNNLWDRVILENGVIGYIYQTYLTEVPEEIEEPEPIKVTGIKLDQTEIYIPVGDSFKINGIIEPDDAEDKGVLYSSTNEEIAIIDENGLITGVQEGEVTVIVTANENNDIRAEAKVIVVRKMDDQEIQLDSSLNLKALEISGIDYKETVGTLREKIITELSIEIVNSKNEILEENALIGTGCKIRVKEADKILREYQIILYGDINGDGKINGIDLLVLQRHILEIERLNGIYIKSANVRKTASKPTSIDLLLIQRHILELKFIEQ